MTTPSPITPPPELVQQWTPTQAYSTVPVSALEEFATKAAQWGANQELEACCGALDGINPDKYWSQRLRATRRPKPPSAVAQAEALIERYEDGWCPSPAQWHVIREGLAEGRRALEAMNDD